ncbi:hypothetical protein H9W90_12695 [Polaribacter pectinis]|uniref:Uncharacterized protein n=1 Tax=Polaribacter pectinis TaxID=2738844 RepID=A0A7G9L8U3_9FLAO|nr:hypothetical protein [Polaribacter pectinis]QNM85042.1 hypothetical protein H9W90_12695 [Polaribacter pectinis]
MNYKPHCDLCDHQILNLKDGNLCGLTRKKPDFNRVCTKIRLNNKLKHNLEEILIEFEELKQSKSKVYLGVIFTLIFGIFVVFCGYFFWRFFLNRGYAFSRAYVEYLLFVLAIVLSTGFVLIKKSFNKFSYYRKSIQNIKEEKEHLESMLTLYNKKYKYKIKFGKEVHDAQEVFFDVKIF